MDKNSELRISIISYERMRIKNAFLKAKEGSSFGWKDRSRNRLNITLHEERMKILLDWAGKHKGLPTHTELEKLADKIYAEEVRLFGPLLEHERKIPEALEWYKEIICFYQNGLLPLEGKVKSFPEAVRQRFATRSEYLTAVRPIINTLNNLCDAMSKVCPERAKLYLEFSDASLRSREEDIDKIFSYGRNY